MPYDENVAFDFHDFDQFYARIWTPGRPGTRSRPLLACQLDLPLSLEKKLAQGFSGFGNTGLWRQCPPAVLARSLLGTKTINEQWTIDSKPTHYFNENRNITSSASEGTLSSCNSPLLPVRWWKTTSQDRRYPSRTSRVRRRRLKRRRSNWRESRKILGNWKALR